MQRLSRMLLGLLTFLVLAPSPVVADDSVLQAAIPLAKPRKQPPRLGGPLDKVEVAIWLPENVKVIKGAVCNPFNLDQIKQKHWQEAARLWDFAVVGANYFGVGTPDYPTLQKALKEFADKSGHPEIEHLPLCFVGMSAGAGMSMKFAELMPERTLAIAPVCLEVGPVSAATRQIPILTIFGEKDGQQMKLLTEKFPAQRKENARWALAIQWGRGHEFARANNLILPFFDDVIRRRYPTDEAPVKGSVRLQEYPESEGWLADRAAWGKGWPTIAARAKYPGDKGAACWLPSERTASVWRAFVASSKAVKIATPAGLGDGQPFVTHTAKTPIAVSVEVSGKDRPKKVELYDGNVLLGECAASPYKFEAKLSPGVHSLIAVATLPDDSQSSSQPNTILVKRP